MEEIDVACWVRRVCTCVRSMYYVLHTRAVLRRTADETPFDGSLPPPCRYQNWRNTIRFYHMHRLGLRHTDCTGGYVWIGKFPLILPVDAFFLSSCPKCLVLEEMTVPYVCTYAQMFCYCC